MKSVKKRVSNKVFMLQKIHKYLTYEAAVIVYKQTILPIIDDAGFLLLACNNSDLDEIQVVQNDILQICTRNKVSDKVSIANLHKKCKIIGLKQNAKAIIMANVCIV